TRGPSPFALGYTVATRVRPPTPIPPQLRPAVHSGGGFPLGGGAGPYRASGSLAQLRRRFGSASGSRPVHSGPRADHHRPVLLYSAGRPLPGLRIRLPDHLRRRRTRGRTSGGRGPGGAAPGNYLRPSREVHVAPRGRSAVGLPGDDNWRGTGGWSLGCSPAPLLPALVAPLARDARIA